MEIHVALIIVSDFVVNIAAGVFATFLAIPFQADAPVLQKSIRMLLAMVAVLMMLYISYQLQI